MKSQLGKSSWIIFVLFYVVLLLIISILDSMNGLLTVRYWGIQTGLLTFGVGIFAIVGYFIPNLSATAGVLLAFTIGIMTIIPSVLMGLGDIPDFWKQYFSVAGGMAGGSFLTFLFLAFSKRFDLKEKPDPIPPPESDNVQHQE